MKLSHKYETSTLASNENILWNQEVQSFFFKILSESPEIDENRVSYNNGIFNYNLSKEEEDFYKNKYVPIGDTVVINESSLIYKFFDKNYVSVYGRFF